MKRKLAGALSFFRSDERGAASLEAAIVLPFVLLLGLGTIEFGWLFAQVEGVQSALRDATRYVSRLPLQQSVTGRPSLPPQAQSAANRIMSRAYNSNGIVSWSLPPPDLVGPRTSGLTSTLGRPVYRVVLTTRFTPASAGLLSFIDVSLPPISLRYEVRHVGG